MCFIILDDADLDLAVNAAVFGKFILQAQICMITNRLIVGATIYDQFVGRFTARVRVPSQARRTASSAASAVTGSMKSSRRIIGSGGTIHRDGIRFEEWHTASGRLPLRTARM